MPATYELHCTSCSHQKLIGLLRCPFAICDDGSRVILPHPGESRTAREHTGLGISELHAADRLGFYQTCICRDCSHAFDIVLETEAKCSNCDSLNAAILESVATDTAIAPCTECADGSFKLVHRGMC